MKLTLLAVGRLKAGPERELVARYGARITASARPLGLSGPEMIEIAESRARREDDRRSEEARAIGSHLTRSTGSGSGNSGNRRLILFDERGKSLSSTGFADQIAAWRDDGVAATAFVIGGPDGLDLSLTQEAGLTLSFGRLTLPHQLVRVLVMEQIYRALTIIGRHPYHRAGHGD
ncbi:23S rRNA (pseudouridine(1915)-N(3))-methyltransferase RlmH [Saliniramus sp.]|uniref:23S rRNA (pseudouridine(1915)-N(3))-methyltransferase RlmH n=1 Tax=Saliniramus sp. TaxID=2986772 RepID=UPI002C5DCCDC|nr:23S rRNA (pseudouridine(1915)-N(3))-methyltransferase RlmH [Saliniramus sp.]HMB10106.1 23S rRNA (pseudouridine(1915)-N(3))-methyltransferase RlmH [Saliniramus sp.]